LLHPFRLKKGSRALLFSALLLIISAFLAACSSATPTVAVSVPTIAPPFTPVATSTATAAATPPALLYTGAREIKASEETLKGSKAAYSQAGQYVGNFAADTIAYYYTPDPLDKIETFYRKTLGDAGWQPFNRLADELGILLVYQKDATKVVVQASKIENTDRFPQEFKTAYQKGDNLITTAFGKSSIEIPGTPGATLAPGQKKFFTIELEKGGVIRGELYPEVAPKTVENFEKLANSNFYNGLTFHRVEPGFVVQGGDPKGDGTGGPGYSIPGEFTTQKKHIYGTLAMARATDPNSAGSQFYIVTNQQGTPNLDGQYAIFGQVTEGMDLVLNIKIGDKMKTVKVENR
jgi:peptidyl-prolyl cis-trans isomerase B (cyclophilin B)